MKPVSDLNKLKQENQKYVEEFVDSLEGLSPKTISQHQLNAELFLHYLAEYEGETPEEGVDSLGVFMTDFFTRKCMWSSPATMKSTAASIKKLYTFLAKQGYVSQEAAQIVKETIKEDLEYWCDCVESYDNGAWGSFF